jgi:hypothetical protein
MKALCIAFCELIQDVCICVIVSRLSSMAAHIDSARVPITERGFAVILCSR